MSTAEDYEYSNKMAMKYYCDSFLPMVNLSGQKAKERNRTFLLPKTVSVTISS